MKNVPNDVVLTVIVGLAVLLSAASPSNAASTGLPAGTIAYVHDDTGSSDALRHYNLRLLNAQNPGQQTVLTHFTTPGTTVGTPAWSRDHRQLAFTGVFMDLPASLEAQSVCAINADGTNLRRITGWGTLTSLTGPTGTVTGRVVVPDLGGAAGPVHGALRECVILAEGTSQTASCDANGNFVFKNVPVGARWVRAQGTVAYYDPSGSIPSGGPPLSIGWMQISVKAGQTTNAGQIVIQPQWSSSLEPSWSRDGKELVVTDEVEGNTLQWNSITEQVQWMPQYSAQLAIWKSTGDLVRGVTFPGAPQYSLSGSDWSPKQDLIACAANGPDSHVALVTPDGSKGWGIYQPAFDVNALHFVGQCRWSPDGQWIAFILYALSASGGPGWSELFVINSNGSGSRKLAGSSPGNYIRIPAWSPDSRFVVFDYAALSQDGVTWASSDLWAVRSDGTNGFTRLTNDGRSYCPAW